MFHFGHKYWSMVLKKVFNTCLFVLSPVRTVIYLFVTPPPFFFLASPSSSHPSVLQFLLLRIHPLNFQLSLMSVHPLNNPSIRSSRSLVQPSPIHESISPSICLSFHLTIHSFIFAIHPFPVLTLGLTLWPPSLVYFSMSPD